MNLVDGIILFLITSYILIFAFKCSLIKFTFDVDKEHESRWTQGKKAKLNSLADDPFHYQAFTMVMDKVKERAISNKRKAQNDNFVKKNMYLIKFWNEYEFERRRRHQDVNQTNHETALKRKELILRFKREKVESLKRIKEQMKIEEQKKRRLINLITSWITIMQQHKAVKMGVSTNYFNFY